MPHWTARDMPTQHGRTAVVTGANSGIGLQTARVLAHAGATVILACRDRDKAEAAAASIREASPSGEAIPLHLDLADLDSVAQFAHAAAAMVPALDLLVLNAGVMAPPLTRTRQGFELQLGVNHLAHFALASRLMPALAAGPHGRVVIVSSTAAGYGTMAFDDLHFERRRYNALSGYCQSKLANLLFAQGLHRRLQAAGSPVQALAAHPGWTKTACQRHRWDFRILNPLIAMQPAQGALPILRAATDPEAAGGDYFGPHALGQWRGHPVRIPWVKRALDDEAVDRLWSVSEQLTGTAFDLGAAATVA